MGGVFSSCRNIRHSNNEITLLMIGLDNAGKTCAAKHLCGESLDDLVPTVGFSVMHLKHDKFNVTIYDLGGGSKIRGIWKNYYSSVYGVIFVVDASDMSRITECKAAITEVVQDPRISRKPLLVLVNKQDIEGAMDESDVCRMLDLEPLVTGQQCPTRMELCSVAIRKGKKMDRGLQMGFHWLLRHIEDNFKDLNERVEKDVKAQKEIEEKERQERLERVRRIQQEREMQQEASYDNGESTANANNSNDTCDATNPFRPISEICAKLESEKPENPPPPTVSPLGQGISTSKVIQVSPIHKSDDSILPGSIENSTISTLSLPQMLPDPLPLNKDEAPSGQLHTLPNPLPLDKVESSSLPNNSQEINSKRGRELLPRILPLTVPTNGAGLERSKKRKKPKKLFQNRVAPNDNLALKESASSSSDQTDSPSEKEKPSEMKPSDKIVPLKPKRSTSNGQVNWAFTEDVHTLGISSSGKEPKNEVRMLER